MLGPSQIIPFLEHQNEVVRSLALRYLSEANDPSPATAEDIWRLIDRFGPGPHNENYIALAQLPHTQASLTRVLQAVASADDPKIKLHLEDALALLSYGLLVRFADLFESAAGLSAELREHSKQRIELASVPAAELWDRLVQDAKQVTNKDYSGSRPHRLLIKRLVEALARNPESAHWAVGVLNALPHEDYSDIYSVHLLGEMRYAPAADLILQKFMANEHADFLIDASVEALVRLGGVHVVQLVGDHFNKMGWGIKLQASDVLRRIKLKQSEAMAIKLLQQENNLDVRTGLAEALCELGTTQPPALDLLGQMVSTGAWERIFLNLDENVTALFAMNGRPAPSRPPKAPPPIKPFVGNIDEDSELDWKEDDLVSDLAPKPVKTVLKPMRRTSAKVGRNDPCPCGSGKKYKKCCGK